MMTMMLCSRAWNFVLILILTIASFEFLTLVVNRYGPMLPSMCRETNVSNPIPISTGQVRVHSKIISRPSVDLPTVFEGVQARPFNPWPKNRVLPCFEPEETWKKEAQSLPANEGFIFVKPYKTGSSTSSGINIRIARNVAKRQKKPWPLCKSRFDHAWASTLYSHILPERTFLWTIVRDPTTRILSQFFHFQVSRKKIEPTDDNFINYVRETCPRPMVQDYYVGALSLQDFHDRHDTNMPDRMNQILKDYNFVGITERMDESMVALAMLLGVPIADILYLTAKGHGGFDDAGGRDEIVCTFIWPSFVTEGVQEFLDSDEWKDLSRWDSVFYQAANRSLDLTIEKLGPAFETNLNLYKQSRELSQERCLHKTIFPCSSGGTYTPPTRTDCMWKDSACGSECLDAVADELELW